jgi:hypothetical protein
VEISLPVSDTGVGLGSVALKLDATEVIAGTPLDVAPVTPPPADGTTHFRLPASAVRGREGLLHFSVTATDRLQHSTVVGPSDNTAILVDDLPPTVTAPHVQYATATPAFTTVCGAGTVCGRGAQASPDHLLRDDSVTVSFDVTDCGVGIGAAPTANATSGGATNAVSISANGKGGTPCAGSSNQTNHFVFTLSLPDDAAALDAPDATGTSLVRLSASGADRFGHVGNGKAASGATSGDGLALVSLVRWRTQLHGVAMGSAALLPVSGGVRQIAFGTDNSVSAGENLVVLNADGSPAWTSTLSPGIRGDLALLNGNLYAAGDTAFNIVPPPAGSATTSSAQSCAASGVHLTAPPAVMTTGGADLAFAVATSRGSTLTNNIYSFQLTTTCTNPGAALLNATGELTGVSATSGVLFFSHGAGFTSAPQSGKSIDTLSTVAFSGNAPAAAPPSISTASSTTAIFGGLSPDKAMHLTRKAGSVTTSWSDATGFPTAAAGSNLALAPVFDGANIYAADDQGKVYAWSLSTGALAWSHAMGAPVSAPVLLQGGSLLVVKNDGTVALVSASGILPLVKLSNPVGSPQPPAVDQRGAFGVAYATDGKGWVSAVQLPAQPVPASGTVWPRPGRDSCNSRNAGSSCQ